MGFDEGHGRNERIDSRFQSLLAGIKTGLTRALFWLVIFLPVLYVPLFVAGLDSPQRVQLFLGLLVIHLVALLGGHSYQTE